jgi:hypothetical protein
MAATPPRLGARGGLRQQPPTTDRGAEADAGSAPGPAQGGLFSFLAGGPADDHIAINRQYRGLRQIHRSPDIYTIDNFFDAKTCEGFITAGPRGEQDGTAKKVNSKIFSAGLSAGSVIGAVSGFFGVDFGEARKSTTWFLNYGTAAPLIRNVLQLLPSATLEKCEEPQVVRYNAGDYFDWHQDALPPALASKRGNGGQRLATVLVYLNDVSARDGGETEFRELGLKVRPQRGKALVFFPALADGTPDSRTLHAGKPVSGQGGQDSVKWIAQLWVHERQYVPTVPPANSQADFKASAFRF